MQDYQSVENYLMRALPMYQREGAAAYKHSLDTSQALDAYDGYPHLMYRCIHVAGTNGKGSVSHMLCSVLMAMGLRVGLFTSPHLVEYRERIRVDGQMVDREYVVEYVRSHRALFDRLRPSFFEMSAALAFSYFAHRQVDFAVVETGMGGRLDSTNVITPDVSVITNISYDHTALLGDSLEAIAGEKAGIIKHARPVVLGSCDDACYRVFADRAEGLESPIRMASQLYKAVDAQRGANLLAVEYETRDGGSVHVETDLLGQAQVENVATVLSTLDVLSESGLVIRDAAVRHGLAHVQECTGLRGRWQVLQRAPWVICDTGHNEAGLRKVVEQIRNTPHAGLHAVLGFVNDKEVSAILQLLPRHATYYWTQPSVPRAMPIDRLEDLALQQGLFGLAWPTVAEALGQAMGAAGREDMVFIGGSTFVVADALRDWKV